MTPVSPRPLLCYLGILWVSSPSKEVLRLLGVSVPLAACGQGLAGVTAAPSSGWRQDELRGLEPRGDPTPLPGSPGRGGRRILWVTFFF